MLSKQMAIFQPVIRWQQVLIYMVAGYKFTVRYQRYHRGFSWGWVRISLMSPADFLSAVSVYVLTPRFIDNVRYGLAIRLAISVRHTRAVEGECG